MFDTRFIFAPGKLTITLDGGAGSSGKGKLGSFLCEHADNWRFACNTFMPQAAHWVKLDDNRELLYHTFNSCAYLTDRYDKLYIAPGGCIEPSKFFDELEKNNIPPKKIGISPLTSVLQDIDGEFERGLRDLNGNAIAARDGGYLAKTGTTAKGCGVNRARRALRQPQARYARDIPQLKEFICDVPEEIMMRLDRGESGLFEIAQGFQLSYMLPEFFPNSTSRNCTLAAGLDDLMIPPVYAGDVIINLRTYPIRIYSDKYVDENTGAHLKIDEIESRAGAKLSELDSARLAKVGITLVSGDSGGGYSDQKEISWEKLKELGASPELLPELTSATQLPRRVFTFSRQNVAHAIRHNRSGGKTYLSLNFANYVDSTLEGRRERVPVGGALPGKIGGWVDDNLGEYRNLLRFVGTGPRTDDMIQIDRNPQG